MPNVYQPSRSVRSASAVSRLAGMSRSKRRRRLEPRSAVEDVIGADEGAEDRSIGLGELRRGEDRPVATSTAVTIPDWRSATRRPSGETARSDGIEEVANPVRRGRTRGEVREAVTSSKGSAIPVGSSQAAAEPSRENHGPSHQSCPSCAQPAGREVPDSVSSRNPASAPRALPVTATHGPRGAGRTSSSDRSRGVEEVTQAVRAPKPAKPVARDIQSHGDSARCAARMSPRPRTTAASPPARRPRKTAAPSAGQPDLEWSRRHRRRRKRAIQSAAAAVENDES